MKHYKVVVTDSAYLDMVQLHDYIRDELFSPKSAEGQYRRIAKAILKLDTFPERFSVVAFGKEYPGEMRRMLIDNYSVFYYIQEETVVVTNVIYSASDFIQRLKIKK